ncbi:MAG: hypothetical protein KDC88_09840 [Ignavibacteriae bacterium]|nr:hypothetical protein [Ignavibacteriota bacterium]MCB9208618.1 hypothetical protein [Ignavibacteriales bacterium]MCB9258272.1 hypothetical protein [Ignavibacteriales bacterium]
MGGKGTILIVLGFTISFLAFGRNFLNLTKRSSENVVDYYSEAKAHNIAVSAANFACNELYRDQAWDTGFSETDFQGGTYSVQVKDTLVDSKVVIATGLYNEISEVVRIILQPSSYAKFAWYTGNMSSKIFITGDTVWGPFHTQSQLNIGGDAVFWGKATTLKGLNYADKTAEPKFYGGIEHGVDIPLPVNYQFDKERNAAVDGVDNHGGSSYFENTDVWLTLFDDGTIEYRTGSGPDSTTYSAPIKEDLTTFAPNGVVYLKKGNIYVSGTLNGKLTIGSGESSGAGQGNIYLVDDLVYPDDPMVWDDVAEKYVPNNDCENMLGLLATNNVYIADTDANVADKDIHVDASIFCAQGGFTMENSTIPPSGTLYLRGGVVAAKEEILALTKKDALTGGYKKFVIFDERFMLSIPPTFPNTGKLEVMSWYE